MRGVLGFWLKKRAWLEIEPQRPSRRKIESTFHLYTGVFLKNEKEGLG